MSVNKGGGSVPNLTFVSVSGPTIDDIGAKIIRAHTTRANFARRRRHLVQEYADKKARAARIELLQVEKASTATNGARVLNIQLPIFSHPYLERKLNGKDAFFIQHLTQAMGKLHLVTHVPAFETALALMQSDWARFLPDPTMLDVSLYFGGHAYAARLQHHAVQFVVDAYKGRAIRSVRERLNDRSKGLSDSLVAAILILSILDQNSGNIEAWKIHISGLLRVITIRSRNSNDLPTHWMSHTIPRTIFQGLILFTRYDVTLLTTIEKTGVFDKMFSGPAKKAAYLILANAEQVAELHYEFVPNQQLLKSEQLRLGRIIKSLDTAIQLNSTANIGETFLTAKALSIKIFLENVLRSTTTSMGENLENTAVHLMEVLQKPDQQVCSSLELCSSLESVFWQTMMGAISAPDARIKSFYISRLRPIIIALALTSWHEASIILQKFFWIPSIFSAPCYQIFSEIQYLLDCTDI